MNSTWATCVGIGKLPIGLESVVTFLHIAVLLLNLWVTMLFSALLGLTLTLWWRQRYFANYGAALIITVFVGFAILSTVSEPHPSGFYNNLLLVSVLAILIGLTYLVAWANVRKSG